MTSEGGATRHHPTTFSPTAAESPLQDGAPRPRSQVARGLGVERHAPNATSGLTLANRGQPGTANDGAYPCRSRFEREAPLARVSSWDRIPTFGRGKPPVGRRAQHLDEWLRPAPSRTTRKSSACSVANCIFLGVIASASTGCSADLTPNDDLGSCMKVPLPISIVLKAREIMREIARGLERITHSDDLILFVAPVGTLNTRDLTNLA